MQNTQMTEIQAWLKDAKGIEADLDGHRISFRISGHNDYASRLMLLQGGRTLSWYSYTLIPLDELNDSPYRSQLNPLLLELNDELFLGRWAVSESGLLLFDVSLPVDDTLPSQAVLSHALEVVCEIFDSLVSMIKFFLKTGRRVESSDRREGVRPSAMECLADRPDLYPLMVELKLLPIEFDAVLRKLMPLPPLGSKDVVESGPRPTGVSLSVVH